MKNVDKRLKFVILICLLSLEPTNTIFLNRDKRSLVFYGDGAKVQAIMGVGIPVDLKRETLIIGLVIKANYKLPKNISQVKEEYVTFERKRRSLSRWDIYKMLSQDSQMRGHGGRSCVLRAICEAADTPIDKSYGFYDELFHTMFSPTSTNEDLSHHTDNEYYAAQKLGRTSPGNCKNFFPDCQKTFLDMFTDYYDVDY